MPGFGRFAKGKPSGAPPPAAAPAPSPEASIPEDDGNWMQFDDAGMDFGNFGGDDGDIGTFGYDDNTAGLNDGHEQEEETPEQSVLQPTPTPANAPNPAPAGAKGLGLSMFKNKANTTQTSTTTGTATTAINATGNAGSTAIQAPGVSDASVTDFQNHTADSGTLQDASMEKAQADSGVTFSNSTGNGTDGLNAPSGAGLGMFASTTRNAPTQPPQATNQGGANSTGSGLSLLANISTEQNETNMKPPAITGGNFNTPKGNPPSIARPVQNFTPRANEGTAGKILPPMRASTTSTALSGGASSSTTTTRILPLPAKKAPPVVNQQPAPAPMNLFANRTTLAGQSTPQPRVAKNPPHYSMARPSSLQTPAANNSNGNRPHGVMKRAPPAVTPSPSSGRNNNNPIMGDNALPPPPSQPPRASPNAREGAILPPPAAAPTAATTNAAAAEDPTPDFNELHAKFLSDIRDLEDTQNFNQDRLLSMEANLQISYSVLLQDQFQFLQLMNKLEEITKETDEAIAMYQESA